MNKLFLYPFRLSTLYFRHFCDRFSLTSLIFFVTYKCNFRCKTCFYANVMDQASGRPDSEELSISEIAKISLSIGRLKNLLISGGEPFLRDDLVEICGIFYNQNRVRKIHLPTNGFSTDKVYDYTRRILNKCPDIALTISLPLDGLQQTHDRIKGQEGSFEKVVETSRKLSVLKEKFKNFKINIITVVNSMNIGEIVSLSEFIKNSLPVDNHGCSLMRGLQYDKSLSAPSSEEWDNLSKDIFKYLAYWSSKNSSSALEKIITVNSLSYLYSVYSRVLSQGKLPFKCQAGRAIGVLEPNGEVRLCELTKVIGNARSVNYDFRKIWFSKEADELRKQIKGCVCAHACFLGPSIKLNPTSLIKSYFWGRL